MLKQKKHKQSINKENSCFEKVALPILTAITSPLLRLKESARYESYCKYVSVFSGIR